MTIKALPDQLAGTASLVRNKVNRLSRSVSDKVDETRCAAAVGIDRTALVVHDGGDKFADLAHVTAKKLTSTAHYVRKNNFKCMMADASKTIRQNPVTSLLVAGVFIFSVGRALRHSD